MKAPNLFMLSQSKMLSLLHVRGEKKAPIDFSKLLRLETTSTLASSAASRVSSKATKKMVEALQKRAAGVRAPGRGTDPSPPLPVFPARGLHPGTRLPPSAAVEGAGTSPVQCSRQDLLRCHEARPCHGSVRTIPAGRRPTVSSRCLLLGFPFILVCWCSGSLFSGEAV